MSDSRLPQNKKQHPKLPESNIFFQEIADLTPELLFVIDLNDLEIVYLNKKVEQLLGTDADSIYGHGNEIFKKILHPEDYQRCMESLESFKQISDQREVEIEVRLRSAEGTWNWFRIRKRVFRRNAEGSVSHTICIAQNIHEQKIADEKLKEEHRRFRDAQAIGHIGSFERPLPGELIICSEEFLLIHGLDLLPKVITIHQFFSYIHPDDLEAFKEAVAHTHASGEPLNVVNRIVRPDGSIRHVHRRSEIIKNEQGTPLRVYGTVQDVTEATKSEHTIRQMLNGSIVAISIMESVRDEDGKITDFICRGANKAAEKILNKNRKDLPGKSFLELWPGVKENLFQNFTQVVEKGEPLRLENYCQITDKFFWLDISAVRNGDGFILTLNDITAQKETEQEVIRLKEESADRATDKYLKLFNSIGEGFCIIEVIFNGEQKPVDFRYIDINPVFEQQTGLENPVGKTIRELVPDIETFLLDIYGQVALTGAPAHFENFLESLGRWFDVKASRIGLPEERQVAVVFNDITARKQREENLSFLTKIQENFTRLSTADEIMQSVGEKMYQHFALSRLTMSDVDEAADELTPVYEKREPHLRGTAFEKQRLSDFVNDSYKREFKTNHTVAINDVNTDPRTADQIQTYKAWGVGSQLHAHYQRQDTWCFIISLQKDVPYEWRQDEIELLQEVTSRLYLRLERARTESSLRASEAKYRDLFNSIEQGFAISEVILDKDNKPFDYRILEVNPRFQALTGISPEEAISGKTLRQIMPELEEKWYRFGNVALTGEPLQLEEYSQALGNRWFEVNVFPTYEPEKRNIAVLYKDITDRKKAEDRINQQNAVLEGINKIFREALSSQTEEDLGRICLKVAEEITGSRISFMGEINPKTGKIEDVAISDQSWKEFGVHDTSSTKKLLPAGLIIHGIYGRVILGGKGLFTNEPSSHPDSIGTPKSHPKLNSFLGVPLFQDGKAIGMVGLANREGGYGPKELEMAEALAPAIVQAFLKKRTEKALFNSEEQFRTVVDLVPDLLWSKDSEGNTDWYNQQWLDYTGKAFEESKEYSWLHVTHPDDRDRSLNAFKAAEARGEGLRIEHRIRRRDGVYRWFLVQKRPMKNKAGKIIRWYGSATDVHEERLAMETLRQSEEKFRFMADSLPQIIWITDAKGNVEFTNKVLKNYTGFQRTPSNTREMAELFVHPEDVAITMENWEKAMANKNTFIVEHRVKSAKGEYRWFLVRAEPFADPETGNVLQWFGTSTDIQENKLSEEALIRTKEEAEKAARAKEEFLSIMSHEIRTPLNAVVGFTHLLLQQNPREDQKESLNALSYSSGNLMSLINDILDFSKIEAGKLEPEENEFDLTDLMLSLKNAHQPQASEKGIELKVNLDNDIPQLIISDQLKLSQVLHNLLGNAVKFTSHGSVNLDISLRKREGERIWIDFAVVDSGIGIAADKISKIFEKFSQADSSTIRHYGGTGLGLTISKMLLELMDSQIKVESEAGKGSRFYFTLPVKAGTGKINKGELSEEPEEDKDLRQLRVLLVEDVNLNRMVISKFLKEWWGIVPDEAVNGKEAVEKASHENYDIILMDVRMPEMNGYEASRLIRGLAGKEATPIVALTADTGQDIKKNPEASLFTDVVTKPFAPGDLRRTILKHLPQKPEEHSINAGSAKEGDQQNFKEVEEQFNEDPEDLKMFYKISRKNLLEYQAIFKEAIIKRDLKKLKDMKHKATILIDTFSFDDLKALLKEAKNLLKEKADPNLLEQTLAEGDALFAQKLKDIQARMEQLFP